MWLSNIFDFNLKDLIFLEMLREAATFLDFNLHEGFKVLEMLREGQAAIFSQEKWSCLICFEKCSVSCGPLKLRIWYKIGKSRDQWKRHNYKSKQSQHINILLKVHLYLWALLLFLILLHDKEPARSDGKRGMATGRPWNTMWYHVIPDNTKQYQAITCNNMQYQAIPASSDGERRMAAWRQPWQNLVHLLPGLQHTRLAQLWKQNSI